LQPSRWQSPPPEIGSSIKTGVAEVIVLYPSGEYGYVACYLIQHADRTVSISRGDDFLVKIGSWTRDGDTVTVTSRTVYQAIVAVGKPIPGPVSVESFRTTPRNALRRNNDKKSFRPFPQLQDLEFLSGLISCDREYWDGQKHIEGPQPCFPASHGKEQSEFPAESTGRQAGLSETTWLTALLPHLGPIGEDASS
jgi:hypothetical protein